MATIPSDPYCIAWHPDGTKLAARGRDDVLRVWEITTGRELLRLDLQPVRTDGQTSDLPDSIAWSPDGDKLAAGTGSGDVIVWDARTGHQELVFAGHSASVWCVAWHPDGRRIASGGMDWQIKVWDADTGQELLSFDEPCVVTGVAWDPTGRHLASASGPANRIRVRSSLLPGEAQ